MKWGGISGETGNGQVKCAPEQVDQTALTDEFTPERTENIICLQHGQPKGIGGRWVIGFVYRIFLEGNGGFHFIRPSMDIHFDIDTIELPKKFMIEIGNGHGAEFNTQRFFIGTLDKQLMPDEIKINLKNSPPVWNGIGGKTMGIYVQRSVPGMILPWHGPQSDLPYYLNPLMKCFKGILQICKI
jgi:hypothetical protein